jgi:hypothetical protein
MAAAPAALFDAAVYDRQSLDFLDNYGLLAGLAAAAAASIFVALIR